MKKEYLLIIFAVLFVNTVLTPYVIGRIQFNNVIMVIQNLQGEEFGSDGDIENVLAVFNFPEVDAVSEPTFIQYYKSGLKTIEDQ